MANYFSNVSPASSRAGSSAIHSDEPISRAKTEASISRAEQLVMKARASKVHSDNFLERLELVEQGISVNDDDGWRASPYGRRSEAQASVQGKLAAASAAKSSATKASQRAQVGGWNLTSPPGARGPVAERKETLADRMMRIENETNGAQSLSNLANVEEVAQENRRRAAAAARNGISILEMRSADYKRERAEASRAHSQDESPPHARARKREDDSAQDHAGDGRANVWNKVAGQGRVASALVDVARVGLRDAVDDLRDYYSTVSTAVDQVQEAVLDVHARGMDALAKKSASKRASDSLWEAAQLVDRMQ